ncbi:MAG: AMP-binding protein, partial [Candidatus Binataceae bacterium]
MMEPSNPIVRRWRDAAREDYESFWARAAEQLHWFRKWDRVLEWERPSFRWFSGGRTNLSYNCLDLQIARGRAGHAALIAEHENGERRVFTYAHLLEGVKAIAAALRALGVKRGDRVAIYMPTAPEAIMVMLAATRIGAMHLVVFAGFGSGALAERCRLAGARVLLAADATSRKGKRVDLWKIVKEAVSRPDSPIEKLVLLTQGAAPADLNPKRDLLWEDFIAAGRGHATGHEVMEANEPAFVLATSGTTATPKLAVHSHGAYQVGISSTAAWCFGLRPDDVWWSTSDIGWIVGHSDIVYAPLLFGCTTIAYEGAIDHPDPSTFYRIAAQNHVSALFTAPTAVRMLMRYGLEPACGYDLSAIERIFCAGEALNAPAWRWLQHELFNDRVPVIDHWWQTETGGPVVGNPYGLSLLPIKPGSAGVALPGFEVEIQDLDGKRCAAGEKGIVVITRPFPGLIPTIWNDPERYAHDYWSRIPGVYFTGDAAHVDEDGYFWFSGRADEIIKIAGHRLGTAEVETAILL